MLIMSYPPPKKKKQNNNLELLGLNAGPLHFHCKITLGLCNTQETLDIHDEMIFRPL